MPRPTSSIETQRARRTELRQLLTGWRWWSTAALGKRFGVTQTSINSDFVSLQASGAAIQKQIAGRRRLYRIPPSNPWLEPIVVEARRPAAKASKKKPSQKKVTKRKHRRKATHRG